MPWFPEIAVGAGLLALVPGLWALRRAPTRPHPRELALPLGLALAAAIVLDLLISARSGGALALGAATAALLAWLAAAEVPTATLALASWGAVLTGLGLLFHLFGGAAGMDDGGWRWFGQLAASFALGSAIVTVARPRTDPTADAADAGLFAAVGAVVIAAATPFVANRVDGVALPVLAAVLGLVPALAAFARRGAGWLGAVPAAALVALALAVITRGLDPVLVTHHGDALAPSTPLFAALIGVALGLVVATVPDRRWAVVAFLAALLAFHLCGPFGVALGSLAAVAAAGLVPDVGRAATVLTALALLAASHSGVPLVTPAHWQGWVILALAVLIPVSLVATLGRELRLGLLRVGVLAWIVMAPFVSR